MPIARVLNRNWPDTKSETFASPLHPYIQLSHIFAVLFLYFKSCLGDERHISTRHWYLHRRVQSQETMALTEIQNVLPFPTSDVTGR